MKMDNMFLIILVIGLVAIILTVCRVLYNRKMKSKIITAPPIQVTEQQNNPYEKFRNIAFSATSQQLKLETNDSNLDVYGCIVEWFTGENIVTIVAFKTGDVSMYLRSGQIYVGGYAHENIETNGLNLIHEASTKISITKYTDDYSLPIKGNVNYYLLTNKGKYYATEKSDNLQAHNSEWNKTFEFVNKIIYEYRSISENK
jgi:hypothetical protein